MIVPDKAIKIFERSKFDSEAFMKEPIAYFGAVVQYPKQAAIIKDWFDVKPKVCVISGWKRVAKTALGAYIGSCWLTGKLDKHWPGSILMGIPTTYEFGTRANGERQSKSFPIHSRPKFVGGWNPHQD